MHPLTIGAAPTPAPAARRFLILFIAVVAGGLCCLAASLVALHREGLLPEPTLTATNCIDDKLATLRGMPLDDRTLVAVGSSTAWRNLDMASFERRLAGTRAFNAGICYLYIDQTAYWTEFILARMPRVRTVLLVVAPRDFDTCRTDRVAFLEPSLAHAYLSERVPRWLPYITGFSPVYLMREVVRRLGERGRVATPPYEDSYGSSVFRHANGWRPPLDIDARCYAGLTAVESVVVAAGARLVVATLPVMPEWALTNDPEGGAVDEWMRGMAAALRHDDTLLIDGRKLAWGDARFADPVHLVYPNHRAYARFVADAIAAEQRPASKAGG